MATVTNAGLAYMARIASGVKRMNSLDIETETINAFDINDRIRIRNTEYMVTHIETVFDGVAVAKIRLTEVARFVADHMAWGDDGLTLTGAVYKYMNEMLPGCQACSQAHAERVAARLSSRLSSHIECAQAEVRRVSERLKKALALAEEKEHCIENLRAEAKQYQSEILRLRGELQIKGLSACMNCSQMLEKNKRIGQLNAELCDAVQRCSTEGLVHELKRRGAGSTVRIVCEDCDRERSLKNMGEAYQQQARVLNERESEIRNLHSAVGKKRNKAERLGKKIEAQNAEIHSLKEKARALRNAVDGLKKTNEGLRQTKGLVASMRAVCRDAKGHDFYVHDFSEDYDIAVGDGVSITLDLDDVAQFVRSVVFEMKTKPTPAPKPDHDDMMDALMYAIHPNCRCAEVPMDEPKGLLWRHVFSSPKVLNEGDTLSATAEICAGEGTAPFSVTGMGLFGHAVGDSEGGLCEIRIGDQLIAKGTITGLDVGAIKRAIEVDKRPYAVLCECCGHVISEEDTCCRRCGASQRPCSECRHNTKEPDESCTTDGGCRGFDCPMG